MDPTVTVTRRAVDRLDGGHLWIYRSDLARVEAAAGDVVRVFGPDGRLAGWALYSDRSQIALRLLSRHDRPEGTGWLTRRLAAAVAFRDLLGIDATAFRLVHGEGDLLPSLIVDRYGAYLVVQTLSQGMERLQPQVVSALVDLLAPAGVLARNDVRVRRLEGLEERVDVLHGAVPDAVEVSDGRLSYVADLWRGQKTGLFLDQRENREAAARYARGRVLDAFSYHGGFALAMAAPAASVTAIDISEEAVARIRANAARNGVATLDARAANVFDELRRLERAGERFDTIVLDPPAFAKNKGAIDRALAGYREINLRALRILEPGGTLVTCSCSYHLDEALFGQVVFEAAADAGVRVTVVEKRMQARDHPVLLGVPETYYLKCFILRRVE
jgi:23S rRNA (cytosine1962-C5)-methyltransferase